MMQAIPTAPVYLAWSKLLSHGILRNAPRRPRPSHATRPNERLSSRPWLVDDPNKDVRIFGTETLGSIGSDAAPAVPKLIEKFKDPYLRWPVRQALVAIGVRVIIPLVKAVRSPDHFGPSRALETLSLMSSDRRFTDSLTASVVGVEPIRPDSSIGRRSMRSPKC